MIILESDFRLMMYYLYDKLEPKYSCVLGLKRGGLVPAVYLSHKFNVPMHVVDITHPESKGDNLDWHSDEFPTIKVSSDSTILIVDDILDSGTTMRRCIDHYKDICNVEVAVLVSKTGGLKLCTGVATVESAVIVPNDSPFIYFPWETKPGNKL